jgi:energy-coupling factor transporter ATP-binding protein EcfA2
MIRHDRFNPFPGLRSFEPDEDHLFFGRERQIDDLLGRLRRTRFLSIVGASGTGKSSLVRSGLIPSLYGGYMLRAGSTWRVALLRPGGDPIGNLAAALEAPGVLHSAANGSLNRALIEATLRRSALGLSDSVKHARVPADNNVLVVVDQFEELFRFKHATAAGTVRTGGRLRQAAPGSGQRTTAACSSSDDARVHRAPYGIPRAAGPNGSALVRA